MKFYVISIVAIFAALGIGIYIGFTLDTQSFIAEQKEDIATKLEERFDFLTNENQELRMRLKDIKVENDNYKYFIDSTYEELVKGKLNNSKIAIIETKGDYMYSGIGQILDVAGADVINITTINDKIMNREMLRDIYSQLGMSTSSNNLISDSVKEIIKTLMTGNETALSEKLIEKGFVDIIGTNDGFVDYVIIAGGSLTVDKERLIEVDQVVVDTLRDMGIPLIGIEKFNANNSYMEAYKSFKISTVDNIDMPIGKVSLVFALEGRPGHYGLKPSSDELMPNLNLPIVGHLGER